MHFYNYDYAVYCIIIAYSIMNSFVIGSGAIPDGLQEELTFPISSVYKCHVSSVMCD